ncbi:Tkp4 protein [Vanderwaltozyma polyspora DSM 70294]|uniref:Tkp4 protein n=1 Tax=Vanderwaltozyma polyspora (strain ATCC 22028 / DSM 70294 / BCRC 21397 / CBS 2163 / NBRC 10782 / NRRL Y-8283 / UCD 57-17) TaxID=436907 RepID=A7TSU1_VANPO|nr:Tkp4 protein [Vanderwaltozyma polyspora DSM 70294]EDO14669.1 Tkp4 protein [Vanderwaltozyma polyspora DSM 70294]
MLLYTKVLLTLKTFPTMYIRNDEILIDTYHMYYIPRCIFYTLIHWININLLRMSLEINKESIIMNDSVENLQHNSLHLFTYNQYIWYIRFRLKVGPGGSSVLMQLYYLLFGAAILNC